MAINDVYQIVARGVYGTADFTNVFWYKQLSAFTQNAAGKVAELFDDAVIDAITPLQLNTVTWTEVAAVNYRFPEDSHVRTISKVGGKTGTGSPAFVAFGYRFPRPFPGMRAGFKRFIGAPDDDVDGNVWTPYNTTPATNLATILVAALVDIDDTFVPVVVKHSDKDNPSFKLELGTLPTVQYTITNAVPLAIVTNQVSRKLANTN